MVAALGAVALVVALSLACFGPEPAGPVPAGAGDRSGWASLGWLALVPVVATIVSAACLVVATVVAPTPAPALAAGVATVPWALLAVVAIAVRLVAQPGLGADLPDELVEVRWPAYLAIAGAAAVLAGAWRALADERTDTVQAREQTERALAVRGAPRPAPPPQDGPS